MFSRLRLSLFASKPRLLVKRTLTDIHEPFWDWRSDMMLTDVTIEDVKYIQKELGSEYLNTTDKPIVYPVHGFIFNNDTRRVFVSLIVARGKHRINVPFLVSSGCSGLYLAPDTMAQLGYQDNLPERLTVNVHGFNGLSAHLSPADSIFSNLNVLGQRFFTRTRRRASFRCSIRLRSRSLASQVGNFRSESVVNGIVLVLRIPSFLEICPLTKYVSM